MKKHLILVLLFICCSLMSYGQCDPHGITTNPNAPVNTHMPEKTNWFWNWEKEIYETNLASNPFGSMYSPFTLNNINVGDKTNALIHAEDYKAEDGWELIAWNMGYDENNDPTVNETALGFFVLYNKYRSILRVFVAGVPERENYNHVRISVQTEYIGDNPVPTLLQNPTDFRDFQLHWVTQKLESASQFNSFQEGNWEFADFYLSYDPCVCLYGSELHFKIHLIEEAQVNLSSNEWLYFTSRSNRY